ncbi:PEGA domain-containing protein [Polyangium aurulentum]|uniref:PEGA domain-containing protein n=1 Tax=Polyangium aurulentum TaxID=2567896 RepID=UPI0010AE4AFD|nr:PEGA domain-containing protein [Polyangium aurulentum]UQA57066.1 PEGA domain-containing protein [Polyangium aurulentum]
MPRTWGVVLLLLAEVALAAPARAQNGGSSGATEGDFEALVKAGDRARAEGRTSAAITAYDDALKIRPDPLVQGRFGLLVLKVGNAPRAAHLLLRAIEEAKGATSDEVDAFYQAYRAARKQVCRLEVETNVVGAAIWVDGRKVAEGAASDFWAFVRPGPHEVRASLEGHADDVQRVELPAGGSERIALFLRPVEASTAALGASSSTAPPEAGPREPATGGATRPRPAARAVRAERPSWTAGLGAAGVYGALAPLPAFGFVGWIGHRWSEVYSVELDVRAAWSPYDIAGQPIRGISVATLPALCAHLSDFSICAEAHLGAIIHQWALPEFEGSAGRFRFGLGIKTGWRIPLSGPLAVRVAGDLVLLTDETAVESAGAVFWNGHPLLGGLSVGGEMRF